MKYEKLARDIMQNIGGEENVSNLVHCATRLRFNLKDNQLPDKEKLKSLEGVLTVVESGVSFKWLSEMTFPMYTRRSRRATTWIMENPTRQT